MTKQTGLLRRLFRWFVEDFLGESFAPTPRQQIEGMLQQLSSKADVAAMARIRADDLYEKLQLKVSEHDELGREAERFLRRGDEAEARRCVERQLAIQSEVDLLTARYSGAQQEAEAEHADFSDQQHQVELRKIDLPEVEADSRYVRARERLEDLRAGARLGDSIEEYDRTRSDFRSRERRGRIRSELERGPHAAIDRSIDEKRRKRSVDEAFSALKQRTEQTVEVEVVSTSDTLAAARNLLTAPRWSRELVPVRTREVVSIKED